MIDEELIEEFIRVDADSSGTKIQVRKISWEGPHTPVSEWIQARTIEGHVSDVQLRGLLEAVLDDPSFFGTCQECGERNPAGWMHTAFICQTCAERNHGVVY